MQPKHWFILFLIILFVILLRIPSLFEPYWYGDEGIYLTIGQTLRRGALLYRDIYDNKPPPIYLLTAITYDQFNFRALTLLWVLGNTLGIFFLAKKLVGDLFKTTTPAFPLLASFLFGVLASIPLFEGNIPNGEILMILPTTLGFLIAVSNKKTNFTYVFAGILFSLSVLFKFPSFFDFAALLAFLFITADYTKIGDLLTKWFAMAVGFAIPIIITVAYFINAGGFTDFINSAFIYNLTYVSGAKPLFFKNDILLLKTLAIFILTAFLWLKRARLSPGSLLIYLWLAFSFYGGLFGGRPYAHYFMQVVPALSLVLAYFFLLPWVRENIFKKLFLGLILATLFYVNSFTIKQTPQYYQNFLSYATGQKSQKDYFDYFDWRINRNYILAQYLTEHSSSNDLLYIWGNEPELYALTQRQPATPFTVAYHLYFTKDAFNKTSKDLNLKKPSYIIKITSYPENFQDLDNLLSKSYRKVGQVQDAEVYKLNNL